MEIQRLIIKLRNNSLFKDSFWAVFGNGFGNVLLLCGGITIAHVIGKDAYGEYGIVKSTMFYAAGFATFGLGYTSTKFTAEEIKNKGHQIKEVVASSFLISFVNSLILCFFLFAFSEQLADFVNTPQLVKAFRYLGFLLLFKALSTTETGILAGCKDFKGLAFACVCSGMSLLLLGCLMSLKWGVVGAFIALVISQLILFVINTYLIYKRHLLKFKISLQCTKKILLFSFPVAIQELSYTLCNWGGMLILAKYSSTGEVGIYSAASQWGFVVLFIPALLSNVVLSYLSSTEKSNHNKMLWKMVLINFVCALIPFVTIFLLSDFIVSFYGASFRGMKDVLNILILGTIAASIANVFQSNLISIGSNWGLFVARLTRDVFIIVALTIFLQVNQRHAAICYAWINFSGGLIFLFLLVFIYRNSYLSKCSDK